MNHILGASQMLSCDLHEHRTCLFLARRMLILADIWLAERRKSLSDVQQMDGRALINGNLLSYVQSHQRGVVKLNRSEDRGRTLTCSAPMPQPGPVGCSRSKRTKSSRS